MNKITFGIIGCGNIGGAMVKAAMERFTGNIRETIIYDLDAAKIVSMKKDFPQVTLASCIDELIGLSDLVFEAVSPDVSSAVLEKCVRAGKDVMIMSIGGVIGNEKLLDEARSKGVKVILPSGAVAGLDAVKAMKISGIESVTLTTRKPPKSLKGAKYLEERGIDPDSIKKETVLFDGMAAEAIKAFPQNINVSAILSLSGIGPEKTRVRIISSPEYTTNSHEVTVKSKAGTLTALTDNVPSPSNPKTSYLAILSAISAIEDYFSPVRLGN
jgi:aspartate dehydrogenase